jgi:hypothetical protein
MSAWKTTANNKGGSGSGEFEKAPPGNHRAILVAMIDLGQQRQEPYDAGGKVTWPHRIYWCWELCDEKKSGSTANHVIGLDLTFSLHEKAKMRGFVEARMGKKIPDGAEFDITTELGQLCLLNVIEKDSYTKIDGISAIPKAMGIAKPTYPITLIGLDELQSGAKKIPDWLPFLYGESLNDVWKRAKELAGETGPREKREKKSTPSEEPRSTLASVAGEQRWDYSDGTSVGIAKTTNELTELFKGVDLTKVRVKMSGQPKESAKTAAEWGIFSSVPVIEEDIEEDLIPF